jgi:hypothetical protein
MALGIVVPAQAYVLAVGGFLHGGSWGQEFAFGVDPAADATVVSVQLTLQPLESESYFEANQGTGVLRDFSQLDYGEALGSTSTSATAEIQPGHDGADAFSCEVWFDDAEHTSTPSKVSFTCEVVTESHYGSRDRESFRVGLRDLNHDGQIGDGEHFECEPIASVPEVGTTLLLGLVLGAGGLLGLKRRRER